MTPRLRVAAGLAIVASLIVLWRLVPVASLLIRLVEWVRAAGTLGVVVYALSYVLATVLLLPASLLTLAAGFIWGPIRGTALVSPTSVVAATAAFLVGRSIGRDWVRAKLAGSPRIQAIDAAVGDNAFRTITLLRLSPVLPFNLLNYALSLTRAPLGHFVLGSFVGMLPATFLYVYLGSLASSLNDLAAGKTPPSALRLALFWGGLAATVMVTVLLTRTARRALARATGDGAVPP